MNADGLGSQAALRIELLGNDESPLPGYSGLDAAVIRTSGFQTPVAWRGVEAVRGLPEKVRLKVRFEGERNTEIRFSALYVSDGGRNASRKEP